MRCKNIKETLVTSIIFVVAVSFMRFYIFFRVMIVRGSISIARSRKPGQNTVLAVISQAIPLYPGRVG